MDVVVDLRSEVEVVGEVAAEGPLTREAVTNLWTLEVYRAQAVSSAEED